jgi:hypothetical protein
MRLVYTRERKHIGIKWSRVTCLALPLAAAQQSLGSRALEDSRSRALEDSQSRRRLTIVTGDKQVQTNKQTVDQTEPNI